MLRLDRSLRPRVSSQLAAVSALALLVSSLMPTEDAELTDGTSLKLFDARPYQTVEPTQDPVPAIQAAVSGSKKISLMIFR